MRILNAANLDEVVDKCKIKCHRHVLMCRGVDDSSFVYTDRYITQDVHQVVNLVDCSTIPPKTRTMATLDHSHAIWDMCCIQEGNKQLLIIVDGNVSAYDMEYGELEWNYNEGEGYAQAVTTDGKGHLFVCDTAKKCIHMFSGAGEFIITIVQSTALGIGTPVKIDWSEEMSSLVVAHTNDYDKYSISVINISGLFTHTDSDPDS